MKATRVMMVIGALLGGCDGAEGEGRGGAASDGSTFRGASLQVDALLEVDRVTLRDGMAYAAVTNRSGASGRMLDVRLAALDRAGEEITWSHSYCMTVEGGTTVLDGAVAHCTWHIRDDQMPASMAVSLDELDPVFDEAPEGFYYVAGEPTYGDAGTSVGWAEATVCSRSRSGSPGLDVIVLDKHGMPWDWGYADEAEVEGDGCRVGRVGGLNLPEKPVIIAHP